METARGRIDDVIAKSLLAQGALLERTDDSFGAFDGRHRSANVRHTYFKAKSADAIARRADCDRPIPLVPVEELCGQRWGGSSGLVVSAIFLSV